MLGPEREVKIVHKAGNLFEFELYTVRFGWSAQIRNDCNKACQDKNKENIF